MKMPSMIVDSKASGTNWQSSWLEGRYSLKQDDKAIESSSQFSNKILNDIKNSCNSNNKDVQKEALKCWELWINNQDIDSWKQNKICNTAIQPLITKKFQAFHRDNELCLIRLKLFWDLIQKVKSFISQFEGPQNILEAFVQSCLTWLTCLKEIDDIVHYLIIKYLCKLFFDQSEDGKSCKNLLSESREKFLLSKNLFNRLVGKFLKMFAAWDHIDDKHGLICLWTGVLELCERYYESIPITVWHNVFRLVRKISSEAKDGFKIRIMFLHRCATVLKSVLNSSKYLDANFVDTTPSEALLSMLIEMSFVEEHDCDFETFLLCQEICKVCNVNIISHRGYGECIPILMKIDDIPLRTLLWGLWGGMMESFQASVASVKSFSVDSFDPVEMKLYRKLRGVAVNFCLDEKYLDDKCALSIKIMVDKILKTDQELIIPSCHDPVEYIPHTEDYEIIRVKDLLKELLGNDGIFGFNLLKLNLDNESNGLMLRNKMLKKINFTVNGYFKVYLDLLMESINKNSYSLQIFVNFKDLVLAATLIWEMFAISILKIEGFPRVQKNELKLTDEIVNVTESKLIENADLMAEMDVVKPVSENLMSDLSSECENKENLKLDEKIISSEENKPAKKRRRSYEVLEKDFKRRRSNRISLKPKVSCCGDVSCPGYVAKAGYKRKSNDSNDCCSKKARVSKCDIEKNKSNRKKIKSPQRKSPPKIDELPKNRRSTRRSNILPSETVEKNISSQQNSQLNENQEKKDQEVVKENEKTEKSKAKNVKKNSSRKETKKPKNKIATKSIKSYFSKINDDTVAVTAISENILSNEVVSNVPKDKVDVVDLPNDSDASPDNSTVLPNEILAVDVSKDKNVIDTPNDFIDLPDDSAVSSIDLIEKCLLENFDMIENPSNVEPDLAKLDSAVNYLENIPTEEIIENTENLNSQAAEESIPVEVKKENNDVKPNIKIENDLSTQENQNLNISQSFEIRRNVKVENDVDLGCALLKCNETIENKELNLPAVTIKSDPEKSDPGFQVSQDQEPENVTEIAEKNNTEVPKDAEPENLVETPERITESSKQETPRSNRNVPQSRAFRMLALIQDPLVSNNVNYNEKAVPEQKSNCKKFPKAEKNSRASRMLALLPEHESKPSEGEPDVKIIEHTRKPFNDQNFISRPELNGTKVASLKKEPGASVLKSPNMATPPRKKSIRFDDDRNETMVYYTDSPPLKSLQRVSFRRDEAENLNKPS